MAVALPLMPIDLKTSISSKLISGFNLSIVAEDCEEDGRRPWSLDQSTGQSPTANERFSSSALKATGKFALHGIDLSSNNCFLSSALPSHKGKLPVVLEENEPPEFLSIRKGSSVWIASSISSFRSITSSSASSTLAFLQKTSQTRHSFVKAKDAWKPVKKRSERKKISFTTVLLQPLKKIRDGYVSCMMGFDGAGDLSGLVQGSVFASPTKYFADKPISKKDPKNSGTKNRNPFMIAKRDVLLSAMHGSASNA